MLIYMEMSQRNSCIAVLNKQKCLFSKMENRKIKQFLSGGWHQWRQGRKIKEKGVGGEYGGNTHV
jgi:hypothetical protein